MKMSALDVLLLVEDERDHANLIMDVLQEDGHLTNEIIWLNTGRKVFDYILRQGDYRDRTTAEPGLILLDLKLPEIDGFGVLERLKQDESTREIPIVVLTTSSNSDDVKKALRLGANDYIVKPVIWEDFERKIRELGKYWCFISDTALAKREI